MVENGRLIVHAPVGWLEGELQALDGTDTIVLIVSHDRSFLAAVATDIVVRHFVYRHHCVLPLLLPVA